MRTTTLVLPLLCLVIAALAAGCAAVPLTPAQLAVKQQILRDIADQDLARRMIGLAQTRLAGGPEFFGSKSNEKRQKEAPVALTLKNPVYPFELRKARVQGLVWIAFVVDRQGHVSDAQSLSEEQAELSTSAIVAVRDWKFRPAIIEGKAEATRIVVPIGFTLD